MSFFRLIDKGNYPQRLFVGGMHGKESFSTINALKKIQSFNVKNGKLIIYNCDQSKYISTLDKRYYNTKTGIEILRLIKYYHPDMYIETHCYNPKNYKNLIDEHRKEKVGVPPLIELEKGVLIGSVSPHIRTNEFKRENVCLTLEMPCFHQKSDEKRNNFQKQKESFEVYLKILKIVAGSESRSDLEKKISEDYPKQFETARNYAKEFFGKYPPF
jgi:hypothetical protein